MKKRMLALFLCFTMIFSMLPGQALAEGEEPGETQPQVTEPAATEPAETEPEITEPETTVPEVTEPEATEPVEMEPEETAPQDEPSAQSDLPGGSCDYSLTWTFDEASGVLAISGSGRMKNYSSGYPWKQYVPYIQQVTVSEGIRQLGEYAFEDCVKLTSVSLPSTLETWDSTVFDGCTNLAEVNIAEGNSNYSSQDGIVYSADGAVLVYYPIGRTETSFTIPSFVTEIGEYAFEGVQTLAEVIIPENVTTINSYAFSLCAALKSVKVLAPVETIGYRTFFSCNALESVTFSEGTTTLEDSAFYFSSANLKNVTFPGTLDNFSYLSFDCATNNNASSTNYCKKVTSAGPIGSGCDFEFGWTGELPTYAFDLFPELEKIIIPETITGMDGYSMRHHLTKITSAGPMGSDCALEYGWTTDIPGYAFPYGVQEIYLPVTVTSISANASVGCSLLTDVYYDGTQAQWADITIDETGNSCLLNATIHYLGDEEPELLTGECGYKATWTFDPATGALTVSGSGPMYEFLSTNPYDTTDVHALPWKDFLDQILSVEIRQGITRVGSGAFSNASNLASVSLPEGLEGIESLAFVNAASLTNITIPKGLTYLHSACFSGCTALTAIFLPSSLNNFSSNALNGASSLSDIYYEGSEEDWAKIKPANSSSYNNATVHFNCTGLGEPSDSDQEVISSVHYFLEWDEAGSIAAFDNGDVRYLVTEETDTAFSAIAETYLNSYVLVHSKAAPDGSDAAGIILAVERLTTMTGTVAAVDSTGITIDGTTYLPHEHLDDPTQFIGEYVVFHVTEYLQLAGLSLLSQEEGYLLAWNADSSWMNISPTPSASNQKAYRFSPSADSDSKALMDTMTSTPNRAILFTVDSLGNVYHVELSGFSSERDAWCFANSPEGFGYCSNFSISEKQYKEVFGESYVATAKFAKGEVASSMMGKWGGNCYGMALVASLMYHGLLDLDDYAGNEFATVNEYYSEMVKYENDVDYFSTMFARSGKNTAITKLIEKYQILYDSAVSYDRISSSYGDLSNYVRQVPVSTNADMPQIDADKIYEHDPNGSYIAELMHRITTSSDPLVVILDARNDDGEDIGHALVIRTDIIPMDMGDGWYRVYVYDPNAPYMPEKYIEQYGLPLTSNYQNRKTDMRYIELNPSENKWRYQGNTITGKPNLYYGCDAAGKIEYIHDESLPLLSGESVSYIMPDVLYVFSPEKTGLPLSFNGTEPWVSKWEDNAYIFLTEASAIRIILEDGLEACSATGNAFVSVIDGFSFSPRITNTVDGSKSAGGGKLSIPYTDFRVEYISGEDISLVGSDFAFNIASDSPVTLDVSMNEGTVTVTSEDGGEILMQLTHIYSNSEYTSVVADGTLEAGDSVTLTLDENTFTGSLTGSGSLELLTDNHNAPESRPLHNLTEGSGTVEIADVTAAQDTIRVALDEAVFAGTDTLYADGQPCAIIQSETGIYVDVPEGTALLVAYTWHVGDETDIHTKYPTGMQVYRIVNGENGYTAEYIPELDNLLQYSGASIRIVGVKGIRMITSITKGNKSALTGEGLAGYALEEYGTALCWATDLAPGEDLVLGKEYTRSNYAYKKDVADPIFAQTADLIQYTNVLVGFDDDQCIPDIVMRPYIILSDAEGNQVTLYGGSIHRSIGYIAYQNRNVFKPGSASYDYVWGIIHHVYGDRFDEDYKG